MQKAGKLAQSLQIHEDTLRNPHIILRTNFQNLSDVSTFPWILCPTLPWTFTFSEPYGSSPRVVFLLASNVFSPAQLKPELQLHKLRISHLSPSHHLKTYRKIQKHPRATMDQDVLRCIGMCPDVARCNSVAVDMRRIQAHESCPGRSPQESQPTPAWTDWTDWTETGPSFTQSVEFLRANPKPFTPGFAPWVIASRPSAIVSQPVPICPTTHRLHCHSDTNEIWGSDFKSSAGLNHLSSHVEDLIEAEGSRIHKLGAMLLISNSQTQRWEVLIGHICDDVHHRSTPCCAPINQIAARP